MKLTKSLPHYSPVAANDPKLNEANKNDPNLYTIIRTLKKKSDKPSTEKKHRRKGKEDI